MLKWRKVRQSVFKDLWLIDQYDLRRTSALEQPSMEENKTDPVLENALNGVETLFSLLKCVCEGLKCGAPLNVSFMPMFL